MSSLGRVNRMSHEPKARLVLRILGASACAAVALSACTPTTTENTMTDSGSPSDPATVKAQVEQLNQALTDLHAFKTESQKVIGPQKWADKNLRNSGCGTREGQGGVNNSVMSQTMEKLDLEESINKVRSFWESKGFATRTETNPRDPGLIRLYADENGGHLLSFSANIKGSSLEMDSVCIAGDQTAIYKELDKQEASSSPSPTTTK